MFGLWIVSATGDIYAGLYYPIGVALLTFVVGSLLLRESSHVRIWTEVTSEPACRSTESADTR